MRGGTRPRGLQHRAVGKATVGPDRHRGSEAKLMADRPPQPEFLLRLRALPNGVPVVLRLRKFLKLALRAFFLKCVSAEELPPDAAEANVGDAKGIPAEAKTGQG
jgi:hypothetical protein